MSKRLNKPYIVLVAGMLIQLCAGIIYMWSIFKAPVELHFNNWEGAALTSSIMLSAYVAGLIVGGRAQDKFGPKKVVFFGSVLICIGMVLTAFVPIKIPELIYLTYGIIGGLGVGIVYTTTVAVVQKWFPKKRGFATGMMVSSFGFSLVLFAPVTKALIAAKGVPFTFIAIGIMFFLICAPCSFLITNPKTSELENINEQKSKQKNYTTKEMLKTRQFYMIAFAMFFTLPAYFILIPLFVSLGVERGLSENLAVLGVMITGIASACGRLGFSWLSDIIGRKRAIVSFILINLFATIGVIFAKDYLFLVCIGAVALSFGGSAGVYPALTADYYGTKHSGLNYGCVMLGFGFSSLITPIVANIISPSGDHTLPLIIAAATSLFASSLIMLLKPLKQTEN